MFEKLLERVQQFIYSLFWCFRQDNSVKIDNREIEYGRLPVSEDFDAPIPKIKIKIPKYEFILVND